MCVEKSEIRQQKRVPKLDYWLLENHSIVAENVQIIKDGFENNLEYPKDKIAESTSYDLLKKTDIMSYDIGFHELNKELTEVIYNLLQNKCE